MFSLDPLRDGTFSFEGRGIIRAIELREVRLGLHGISRGMITLRADDVRQMLQYDVPGVTLRSGSLASAKFRFHLQQPGAKRRQQMTFTITPPTKRTLATAGMLSPCSPTGRAGREVAVIERLVEQLCSNPNSVLSGIEVHMVTGRTAEELAAGGFLVRLDQEATSIVREGRFLTVDEGESDRWVAYDATDTEFEPLELAEHEVALYSVGYLQSQRSAARCRA